MGLCKSSPSGNMNYPELLWAVGSEPGVFGCLAPWCPGAWRTLLCLICGAASWAMMALTFFWITLALERCETSSRGKMRPPQPFLTLQGMEGTQQTSVFAGVPLFCGSPRCSPLYAPIFRSTSCGGRWPWGEISSWMQWCIAPQLLHAHQAGCKAKTAGSEIT